MSNEEFKKFVSFLIDDKHVQDPDVLLFKGVFDNLTDDEKEQLLALLEKLTAEK